MGYKRSGLTPAQLEIRDLAMSDLRAFIGLVAPYRVFGHCHHDMMKYLMEAHPHQLVLWPRGHQKSAILGYWAAWHVVNNPTTTILYATATAPLAEKQLAFIKNILDCEIVRKYWPELLAPEIGMRTIWRADEIAVDHPDRLCENIRDPSIKAVGSNTTITGFHADVVLLDDIVVLENSETKTEREKIKTWYSLLNSILNPGGFIKAVGTRYHPDDLWGDLTSLTEPIFNEVGEIIDEQPVYTYSMKVVEQDGEFLWPRHQRYDGKWFGFDLKILSKIRSQYIDKSQFYAQYYNDPSDPLNKRISNFQYYDREHLKIFEGRWCVNGQPLNIYAAIDFAASITAKADYTAIVVIGIDYDHRIYVLDVERFKTNKISVMAENLEALYGKWRWIRLRAEINAQQGLVVEQIRDYNRKRGVYYTIDTVNQITNKAIRIMTNLEPRYAEGMVLHYRGGNCQLLEDELSSSKPPHDDMSDALASCVEIATAPSRRMAEKKLSNVVYHPKWGGVR